MDAHTVNEQEPKTDEITREQVDGDIRLALASCVQGLGDVVHTLTTHLVLGEDTHEGPEWDALLQELDELRQRVDTMSTEREAVLGALRPWRDEDDLHAILNAIESALGLDR